MIEYAWLSIRFQDYLLVSIRFYGPMSLFICEKTGWLRKVACLCFDFRAPYCNILLGCCLLEPFLCSYINIVISWELDSFDCFVSFATILNTIAFILLYYLCFLFKIVAMVDEARENSFMRSTDFTPCSFFFWTSTLFRGKWLFFLETFWLLMIKKSKQIKDYIMEKNYQLRQFNEKKKKFRFFNCSL